MKASGMTEEFRVVVGDPDLDPGGVCGAWRELDGMRRFCTRGPHPTQWTDDVDPLAHVAVGDPDPTSNSGPFCTKGECTRMPHPDRWQHIAGDGERVLAVGAAVLGSAD